MRYAMRPLLIFKTILLLVTWAGAAQAQHVLKQVDPADLAWWTWGFIVLFSAIGWAIAELDKLAEILEPEGLTRQQHMRAKLKYGQGFVASQAAGVSAYFLAKIAPAAATSTGFITVNGNLPEMAILLMVFAAGFGGIRFVQALSNRWTPGQQGGNS